MKKAAKPNILERTIEAVSPQWAFRRHQARSMLALSGGYVGAGFRENMVAWQPGVGDADMDAVTDLRMLRARSRDLGRNSPIASGALETQITHVVGTGLSLQARIHGQTLGMTDEQADAWQSNTERLFAIWAESELSDAYGCQNFYEQQALAFRTTKESGDGFVVLSSVQRPDWSFALALQIIEADRVSNPKFAIDTPTMVQGIEKDERGASVAVHICNRHPGAYTLRNGMEWSRVPMRGARSGRRNVLHLVQKKRPGQTRGIPQLAPIIETLKQLTRYSSAEVDAAVNSASIAMFAKMDPDAFDDLFTDEAKKSYIDQAMAWDGTVRSGKVINTMPGEEITSPVQNRPNPNFDAFVQAVLTQIGMALNIPKEVLAKHFQASYSAARAALLDAWRVFRIERQWLAAKFCQPVYEEWLADAVARGLISAPGFFADPLIRAAWCKAMWSGDGPGAIDPEKEANAAAKRIETGITTLDEEIIAYDGGDWESKHRRQTVIRRARERDGLEAPVDMQPGSPGGGQPQQTPAQPPQE
jgi:lambda family phage portal protein